MSTLKKIACNGRATDLYCKFMIIKESKVTISIAGECRVLAVNQSSYYKWLNKKPCKTKKNAEAQLTSIYHKYKSTYARERITQALRNEGILIKHKQVYRIMRQWGLKAVIRKRWSIREIY